jgi:hypothetical protein
MRAEAEAGTDGAMICLYDPAALPDDFDAEAPDPGFFEELQAQGRLFFSETGGDGSFLVHVHADETMPEPIARCARDPIDMTLEVPSGTLVFCGAEYAHKHESPLAKKHPLMLAQSRMTLPSGRYRARMFRGEYGEDELDRRFDAAVSTRERLAFRAIEIAMALVVVGFVGGLALGAASWWYRDLLSLLVAYVIAWVGLVVSIVLVRRTTAFRVADAEWERIQQGMPTIIAVLTREPS